MKRFLGSSVLVLGLTLFISNRAFADGLDNSYFISAYAASTYAPTDQGSSGSYAAVLNFYNQAQGIDAYGRSYSVSSMAHADSGGFGLYASSSLTGGSVSGYGLGAAQAEAGANMSFDFIVPADVDFISLGLYADGHGTSKTGADAVVSGNFSDTLGSLECTLQLDGSVEETLCGPLAVTPGEFETFSSGAAMIMSSFEPGDSALLDYWGTFSTEIDYYDANMNLIGQYDFPAPPSGTPEPSTLALLGTGLIGAAAAARRRLVRGNRTAK